MLNRGVTLGLFQEIPIWILVIVWVALLLYAVKLRELIWGKIGIGLILLGGAGNLVNRVTLGGALDNWNFFGIFYNNVWDYLIVAGVIMYLIQGFRLKF